MKKSVERFTVITFLLAFLLVGKQFKTDLINLNNLDCFASEPVSLQNAQNENSVSFFEDNLLINSQKKEQESNLSKEENSENSFFDVLTDVKEIKNNEEVVNDNY